MLSTLKANLKARCLYISAVKPKENQNYKVFRNHGLCITTYDSQQQTRKVEALTYNQKLKKPTVENSLMASKMQRKSKSVQEKLKEIDCLENQLREYSATISRLTKENNELEETFASISNYDDPVRVELEMEIKQERAKCITAREKVETLEAQLESVRYKCNEQKYKELAKKDRRIGELESVLKISSDDKKEMETKYLERIASLENKLQETQKALTFKEKLNNSLDEANKILISERESNLKEKNILEEKVNEKIQLMTDKDEEFKKAQQKLKRNTAKLKQGHKSDKLKWENEIKGKNDEIKDIKEKHAKLIRFVENLKIRSGFEESKDSPSILKELEEHIGSKLCQVKADSILKAAKLPPKKRKSTTVCDFTMKDLFGHDDFFKAGCDKRPKMSMREKPNEFIQPKAFNNFGIPSVTVVFQNQAPGSSSVRAQRISAIQFGDHGKQDDAIQNIC